VGVTRYCNYPPEIESLPKIGGYDNPSVEAIARLRPNLVVALQRHSACADTLRQEGIPVLVLQEGGIDNIMANLDILARTTMAGELAENVIADLHRRMETISSRTAGRKRPSVLVSVGRNMGDAGLREVYIAAQEGFYDRMIEIAGGRNACQDTTTTYPRLTPEGVTRLNPDVILDMVDDPYRNGTTPGKIASEWSVCSQVSAVQHRRVHVLSGNHVVVPGPRFILILEQMAGLLHPEIDWSLK
jgi:iron complex transport system substrate-binding protein